MRFAINADITALEPNGIAVNRDLRSLITMFEWSTTALGPRETWSVGRRNTIDLLLRTHSAIATLWGPTGIMIYNDACAAIIADRHPAALGARIGQVFPEAGAFGHEVMERAYRGDAVMYRDQRWISQLDGRSCPLGLDISCSPIVDSFGDADGVLMILTESAVSQDAHRQPQSRIDRSETMEAVSQLAASIAHDFNNLLAGVIGNLDMAATRLAQNQIESAQSYFGGARSAAGRAAVLTKRLLAFSRPETLAPSRISIAAVLRDLEDLASRTVDRAIDVQTRCERDIRVVYCDLTRLENALLALVVNACDAMPDGGTLTIGATNATRHLPTTSGSGDYVLLTITDCGCGMGDEVLARAFEPLFTTKSTGPGAGLGLSMVYQFAQQSGGHIEIQSAPGAGTTVRLFLPSRQ